VKVLAVDDSPVFRALLKRSLEALGHAASVAEDGEQALAECQVGLPDVVVSDWSMPGINGRELCAKVRELSGSAATPYFILITALDDKEQLLAAIEGGVSDYLPKPFDQTDLQLKLLIAERHLA